LSIKYFFIPYICTKNRPINSYLRLLMKKIYLSFLGIAALSSSFAQKNHELLSNPAAQFVQAGVGVKPSALSVEKAAGVVVWSDDFTDPSTWTINNSGQTAPTFGWDIGPTESSWWTSQVINSISDGNFAELGNGNPTANPATQALDVTYTLTTASAIAIPNGQVSLSFLQYGARFNDAQEMYVSTDGSTWVRVGDNSNHSVLSSSGGSAYTNPTTKTINLASYLGAATSVWIRFSWTTAYPSSASNPNVWVTYGWMIDDVSLTTNSDDDIAEIGVIWGASGAWETMPYYQIPLTQISPLDFGGILQNNGINDQNDVVFTATATGYAGASLTSTIASSVIDTVWVDNPFTPAATVGANSVSFSSDSGVDDVTSNNGTIAPVSFTVTNFVYARDKGTADGTQSNGGLSYEVGNVFDIFADQTLYSVDVVLKNTTVVGSLMRAIVYDIDPQTGDFTEIDRSDDYEIVAGNPGQKVTLELVNTTDLLAGTPYFIAIGTDGGTSPDVVVSTSGKSSAQTSFFMDETGTWFYTTNTPMVRMNFQDQASIDEITHSFGMFAYPNPTSSQTTVALNLKNESTVSIAVTDVAGKVVFTNKVGKMTAGQHQSIINTEAFTSGVYYVTVSCDESKLTQKIVKK
jgi:hypothetical protein